MKFYCLVICDESEMEESRVDFVANLQVHFAKHQFEFVFVPATTCPTILDSHFDIALFFSGVGLVANGSASCDAALCHFVQVQRKSIILCGFSNHDSNSLGLTYGMKSDNLHPFSYSTMQQGNDIYMISICDKLHPLFCNISEETWIAMHASNTLSSCTTAVNATTLAYWSNFSVLAAERKMSNKNTIIALNLHPISSDVHSGNMKPKSGGFLLIYNAIVYAATLNAKLLPKLLYQLHQYRDVTFEL